jgi:membrane fusion protein (multidrug efflux system)
LNEWLIDEKIERMKNVFRITVLLLLIILVAAVLLKNRRSVQFETDMAKTVIDSIPVSIVRLKPDSAGFTLETAGKVKSADEVYVVSQAAGEINQVFVKIGEVVKKGDVIIQINDFYARQEFEMAKKAYEQTRKDYTRYADLAGVNAVTQQQLEQLRLQLEGAETKMNSLEQRLHDYIVKAPVNGIVNQLFVSRGNATGPGTPVCEIVGGKSVKIEAKINPEEAKYLYVGLKAVLSSEFGHGDDYRVQLAEIGEKAGKFGGIATIFTLDPREKNSPVPGSIGNIRIEIPGEPKLLVPRQALTNKDGEMGIFVVNADDKVVFTPIKYLDFDDNHIAIIGKEFNNSAIVVEGSYLLKTGDLVKEMN